MKATTPAEALAVTLADELHRCGVTDAVLAPGSRSAPLAYAFHRQLGVRLHVQIDERSAAFTALGLAKASGRPAAAISTSGTAAANFLPAVAEAWESRTPLLVLTADRPPELRHTAANQTIDQVKLYGDRVRWFVDVGVPDGQTSPVAYWRSLAARAYHTALGPSAGPVHLNLAFRDPLAPVEDQLFPHPLDGREDGGPSPGTT
jgi:2-succinyl-5-enolpyruvyl-6-hydroxy-3-cyclohexene-1-carboxylate synthase